MALSNLVVVHSDVDGSPLAHQDDQLLGARDSGGLAGVGLADIVGERGGRQRGWVWVTG